MIPQNSNQLTRTNGQPPQSRSNHSNLIGVVSLEPEGSEASNSPAWYLDLLWRRKKLLLLGALFGVFAASLYTASQQPLYKSRTTLEVQGLNDNFLNMKDIDPMSSGNFTPESMILTQLQLMQSETLLEASVVKMRLGERLAAVQKPTILDKIKQQAGLKKPAQPRIKNPRQLVAEVTGRLTPRLKGQSQIVEVSFEAEDPAIAADFLNVLTDELIEQSQERRWQATQKTGEWLGRHLKELKQKLERSEAELQAFAGSSGLVFGQDKDTVAEQKLSQLQDELLRAQNVRIELQSRYDHARSKPAESLAEIVDNESLRDLKTKIADLRRELAVLETTLTPAHYRVVKARTQIAALQSSLERERGNMLRKMGNDYEMALGREKLLAGAYATQDVVVAKQSSKAIQYNSLKREVETSRQVYESMLQRVKAAGIAGAIRASNISVVDPAKPPLLPFWPNPTLNVAFGLLAGLVAGVGLVVIREQTDRTIRGPGFSTRLLQLPELGVIPSAKVDWLKGAQSTRSLISARASRNRGNTLSLNRDDLPEIVELAMLKRKDSLMAECFRATLTSILFAPGNGNQPRVLLVTSPSAMEGKTTTISNLGIALAEVGRRVLLVDGDMRRPRLHKIFGLSNDSGFKDCLQEPISGQEEHLPALFQKTSVENLHILTSGGNATATAGLLSSGHLPELLRKARRVFDIVLVDSPPVLLLSDARIIARECDGVILVLRAGQSTEGSALAAANRLVDDGALMLGTILTHWDPKETNNYSYGVPYEDYSVRSN